MNEFLLAAAAPRSSITPIFLSLIVMGIYVFLFALVIICLIRIARFFRTAGKEQKLIRLELGKVAEEVHLLRKELKGDKENSSPPTVS
jgi:hypothetical protein